jgi:hypothetical protein
MPFNTYFVRGPSAKCPKCGGRRYTGPADLRLDVKIACTECDHERPMGDALHSAIEAWDRKQQKKAAQKKPPKRVGKKKRA